MDSKALYECNLNLLNEANGALNEVSSFKLTIFDSLFFNFYTSLTACLRCVRK